MLLLRSVTANKLWTLIACKKKKRKEIFQGEYAVYQRIVNVRKCLAKSR